MEGNERQKIHDVEYYYVDEGSNEKRIRGKVLYYSTKQVADLLNVSDATIRYYSDYFEDILKIRKSNYQRQYTDDDISKLEFIFKLRAEGMTMKQVKAYCQEVDFKGNKPIVKESNPLSIQAVAKALLEEQTKQIIQMKEDLKLEIANTMKGEILERLEIFLKDQAEFQMSGFEVLKEDIENRVSNSVEEKLNSSIDNFNSSLNGAVNEIKEAMDIKYVSREEIEKLNKKKGLFSRIFK